MPSVQQLDLTIYRVKCSHLVFLSTENCAWCPKCKAWIDGEEVGDIQVLWTPMGTINVFGGGFAPHET